MAATDPEQASAPLGPFVFDVAETPGYTNVEMMGDLPDAEQLLELLGRDLVTKVLVQTPSLCVYHESARPGERVKPHRHGTYQVNYVLRGELLFGIFSPNNARHLKVSYLRRARTRRATAACVEVRPAW